MSKADQTGPMRVRASWLSGAANAVGPFRSERGRLESAVRGMISFGLWHVGPERISREWDGTNTVMLSGGLFWVWGCQTIGLARLGWG